MSKSSLGLVTHCDLKYLSRALALINSLRTQGESSPIYVLCHDSKSFDKLAALGLEEVYALGREEMFQSFPELVAAERDRTPLEFYYCFSPYLLKYLQNLGYENLVYLDSDLYFYGDLESPLALAKVYDVGIVPHRFESGYKHLVKYGIYNVGLVYFKNNEKASNVLNWWAESCINSTKLEVTVSSFGDQKYLEFFKLKNAEIFEYYLGGHNAAPWNCHTAALLPTGEIQIKGDDLLYFHFSSLRIYGRFARLGFSTYRKMPNRTMKNKVYRGYIRNVLFWEKAIGNPNRVDDRPLSLREIVNAIKYRDYIFI